MIGGTATSCLGGTARATPGVTGRGAPRPAGTAGSTAPCTPSGRSAGRRVPSLAARRRPPRAAPRTAGSAPRERRPDRLRAGRELPPPAADELQEPAGAEGIQRGVGRVRHAAPRVGSKMRARARPAPYLYARRQEIPHRGEQPDANPTPGEPDD